MTALMRAPGGWKAPLAQRVWSGLHMRAQKRRSWKYWGRQRGRSGREVRRERGEGDGRERGAACGSGFIGDYGRDARGARRHGQGPVKGPIKGLGRHLVDEELYRG